MQMNLFFISGGSFAPVAPMLFTSQLTLPLQDTDHSRRQIQKKKGLSETRLATILWEPRVQGEFSDKDAYSHLSHSGL